MASEMAPNHTLTARQESILSYIADTLRERGFPPSVREIGEAVGLTSPSTVHSHLATLQKHGFLRRDPDKPRAIEVRYDPRSGKVADKAAVTHVPLVGDVAAGTDVLAQSNVEELMPIPAEFTSDGELFMLRVRGDSMVDAGIFDGDFVVVRVQPTAELGEIVVAGIPGDEGTVKRLHAKSPTEIILKPENPALELMVFTPDQVTIFGKVVTVMRKL
ncbi:MAG: transcriptional repressor LexA [Acidimicrobiales bacterium]|jgi:repressor LexA